MTVDVTTTQNPVTVSVNDTNVSVSVTDNVTTATVSGGTGPQGPSGGTSPATTTTIGGIIVGSGLTVTANGTLSSSGAVSSVAGRTGAVTLTTADVGGLGTVATLDVAAAGNATTSQVVKGNDTRLSDSRTPSSTLSHASTHAAAGSDPVTLTIAQTTGLQTALDAKAPLASPAFTGTVTGITKSMVGLGSVDNVADDSKPVSTAQAAADAAVQAYAIQRANHTGTQASTTITGLGTLATQSGTFSGTSSGTNTGDQTITLTGDVTGSGTGSFSATLAASGATAGTYTSVTVDAKGRVTAGTNPATVTSVAGRTGAVTIASSDVSGLAASATTNALNADNISSGTLLDARLSANVALVNNIIGAFQGYDAANSFYYIETMPRIAAFSGNSQGSGGINFVYFTPIKTVTVSSITFIGTTASTGLTLCRFGLYTFDGTSVTLVASTTSETTSTIFTTANTAYKRSFTSNATYTLAAGSRYAVACIQVGTTPASLLACSVGVAIAATTLPRLMSFVSSGLTDLPSSRNTSGDSSSAAINYARLV